MSFIDSHVISYPTAVNLNYFWSFGSAAGIALVIQIISGLILAMHYTPHFDLAFKSVEHIMRDVNSGWILRYLHANGASIFFTVIYLHMFRGIFYGSYFFPRQHLWMSGIFIFLLMMATAFMGYVLPWGQMSFWGATVITNLFSAIPVLGKDIVEWLWGGFSVSNATLNRFLSLHYFVPFLIVGLTVIHLSLLHRDGSNNPLGVNVRVETVPFFPYFYVKDMVSFFLLIFLLSFLIFFSPNALGHPDNYVVANPLVTPPHIVPEWYFLPFYAILRSIPDKLGGVLAMVFAIVILLFVPNFGINNIRSTNYRPSFSVVYWFLFFDFLLLGWLGQKVVESPYIELGIMSTFYYFFIVIALITATGTLETTIIKSLTFSAQIGFFLLLFFWIKNNFSSFTEVKIEVPAGSTLSQEEFECKVLELYKYRRELRYILAAGYLTMGLAMAIPAIVYGPFVFTGPTVLKTVSILIFTGDHLLGANTYDKFAATFPIEVVQAVALLP